MNDHNIIPVKAKKVGLLGGTFNPAHIGHRFISLQVMKAMGIDCIVWLVSPQNPLKTFKVGDTLAQRTWQAREVSDHPNIIVTDIEKEFENSYTVTTIKNMKSLYPDVQFVWVMGADNMVQFHRWNGWQEIVDMVPICVYDRGHFANEALESKLAKDYKGIVLEDNYEGNLNDNSWYFLKMEKIDISSTELREAMSQ